MPRRPKKEIVYTGKALKLHEKIQKLEIDLKATKEELKIAYKDQVKSEKAAAIRDKKAAAIAAKKEMKENKARILKAIQDSGKTPEEILELLSK